MFSAVLKLFYGFSNDYYGFVADCFQHLPSHVINLNVKSCSHIPHSGSRTWTTSSVGNVRDFQSFTRQEIASSRRERRRAFLELKDSTYNDSVRVETEKGNDTRDYLKLAALIEELGSRKSKELGGGDFGFAGFGF